MSGCAASPRRAIVYVCDAFVRAGCFGARWHGARRVHGRRAARPKPKPKHFGHIICRPRSGVDRRTSRVGGRPFRSSLRRPGTDPGYCPSIRWPSRGGADCKRRPCDAHRRTGRVHPERQIPGMPVQACPRQPGWKCIRAAGLRPPLTGERSHAHSRRSLSAPVPAATRAIATSSQQSTRMHEKPAKLSWPVLRFPDVSGAEYQGLRH